MSRLSHALFTLGLAAALSYPGRTPAQEAREAPKEFPLYPGAAPGSEGWNWEEKSVTNPAGLPMATNVVRPVLLHYPADRGKAVGTAMIVAPGGGFRVLMMSYEGADIARRLNAMGVDAFILKYRLVYTGPDAPRDPAGGARPRAERPRKLSVTGAYKAQAGQDILAMAADDGRRAVRLVREKAAEFEYRPDRVGMIGFSAGGVVTSEALFGPAETRPDFAAVIYGAFGIKEAPSPAPPLFLAVAADDALAVDRTVEMFTAYRKGKGPAELHVFQARAHGFVNKGGGADHFMDRLEEWLAVNKVLEKSAGQPAANEKEVVGTWKLKYEPGDGQTHEPVLTITKDGSALKAEFVEGDQKGVIKEVQCKDGELRVKVETQYNGETATVTYTGKPDGDELKGEAEWEYQGMSGSFPFEGRRHAEKPRAQAPSVVPVAGKPSLPMGNYDVAPLGYQVDEFFLSGTATSYKLSGEATADGKWDAVPAGTAPYTTRIVVVRPRDPAKFSGTAVVEWLNVSGGLDVPVVWNMAHREIVRRGQAYVGVSAQKIGVEGGPALVGRGMPALKQADPGRYGRLGHPGDAYSFDIFSQAGRLVKDAAASRVLGPLVPRRVIAVGESQSAFFLTTYATAVDPVAGVYDGILIHSRAAGAAPLDGGPILRALASSAKAVKLRPDLRVPALTVITESDLLGWFPLIGYHAARQADTDRLRVWEIAGTAHADNYTFTVGFIDSGTLPAERLAAAYAPASEMLGRKLDRPMNFGPQHHYVVQAALWQLDRWVRTGQAAPKAPGLKLTEGKSPQLVTDANGLAEGGLRTPWVDVPTALLSGAGSMVGFGKSFDAATLERLYPGGKAEYLKKFEASLDSAIAAGFIVPEDKPEIMELAALGFTGTAEPARTKD